MKKLLSSTFLALCWQFSLSQDQEKTRTAAESPYFELVYTSEPVKMFDTSEIRAYSHIGKYFPIHPALNHWASHV